LPIFAVTIFTAAFLLFQVQPIIAKYILPWFGGSPSVWTTAMLFFQAALLGGYAYAHFSIRYFRPRGQAALHVTLLVVGLALLPITPAASWKPEAMGTPTLQIMLLLLVTVGWPFLVLASTSPLLQAWFSRLRPGVSPYRLYALSNVGSLLALVSYPILVEPTIGRTAQTQLWSGGFGLFAVLSAACALWIWQRQPVLATSEATETPSDASQGSEAGAPHPGRTTHMLWLGLPAVASVLLLAVTNQMSQDVAVIPFLWVLPLSLYLLSFIIAFDHDKWYNRTVFTIALIPAMAGVVWMLFYDVDAPVLLQIGVLSIALFICCMACHGELARLKPDPRYLTSYFLGIAAGGALGGVLVGVVAPLVFDLFLELHLGLLACGALVLLAIGVDKQSALYGGRPRRAWGTIGVGYVVLAVTLGLHASQSTGFTIARSRSFYGVLRVHGEEMGTALETHSLQNGRIYHGIQYMAANRRRFPTTYYTPTSGIGMTFEAFPRFAERRVGIVGLGVGTLATYSVPGDYMRIYEIDPDVLEMATDQFTYLADSEARVEVVLGDARLSMEREAPQAFDILVLDAFSSDAVPVHLLTEEAFEIYRRHLKPDGVIAIHFTSRYFDLEPVLRQVAQRFEMEAAHVYSDNGPLSTYRADWMLLSTNEEFLNTDMIAEAARREPLSDKRIRMWTDDYSNLFQVLAF
jgi:SAM-dependent methyltransferase